MDDIQAGLRKAALFGLACAITILPLMMIKSEDVPDMEEIMKKHVQNQDVEFSAFPKDGESYKNAIKGILVASKEKGLLEL